MSVGVVFRPQQPPEELHAVVEHTDAAGVGELWLWEDCFLEGGLTSATAALAWSERLHVGIGLLPVPLRNPAVVAMEVATLSRLFPGRFVAGLGHGVGEWMAQVGAGVTSPMTLLREHTDAVRALLDGERVDVAGRYVRLDDVALGWPPPQRPMVVLGAHGPRTLRLAGEVADGVLLDGSADVEAVRRARVLVDEGRAASGRGGSAHLALFTEVDPDRPASALRDEVAARVGSLLRAGADSVVLQGSDQRPDPRPLVDALVAADLV